MTTAESRLRAALLGAPLEPSDDLFARVSISIDDDRRRHRQRRAAAAIALCCGGAIASVVFATLDLDNDQGGPTMDWWILEIVTTVALLALALWLGPLIKRYGRSYAADVFRSTPRTGKSYLVLADVAYYMIFLAYIMFTVNYGPRGAWSSTVTANQLEHSTVRIGGILLIIGVLHSLNLVALPLMGRLLAASRPSTPSASTPSEGQPATGSAPVEG